MSCVSLVVFCGLPGSGKTHLVQNLVRHGTEVSLDSNENQRMQLLAIDYDEILPPEVEKSLIEKENMVIKQVESDWKRYRRGIVQCVEILVKSILAHTSSTLDPRAIVKPENVDDSLLQRFVDCISASLSVFKDKMVDMNLPICILIDDNMYYSSMRYVYYQLARKYTVSFCQIYVSVGLETALFRNNIRKVKVNEDTIIAMATKLEAPDSEANYWETNSITVNGKPDLEAALSFIKHSFDEPVQRIEEVDKEMINQSRVICSQSFLHQSDQIIRKLVAEEMSKAKAMGLNSSSLQYQASVTQRARKDLLASLQSGSVCFPEELVTVATGGSALDLGVLTHFLRDKFENMLSEIT